MTPWIAECQASLSFSVSWSLLKLMSIESMVSSNHLILCYPLLILSSIFPRITVFSSDLAHCTRCKEVQSVRPSTSVLPMNIQGRFPLGLTGLISLLSKGLPRIFSSTTGRSINSSEVSLLYDPTLTSIHDYWKYPYL